MLSKWTQMPAPSGAFPHLSDLVAGTILCTISQALFFALRGEGMDRTWNGDNYILTNEQGSIGVVTFGLQAVIGAFCDTTSDRFSKHDAATGLDSEPYLLPDPLNAIELSENNAIALMRHSHYGAITSYFWTNELHLQAREDWPAVFHHGAHLLAIETTSAELVRMAIKMEFGFDEQLLDLVFRIHTRRLSTLRVPLMLTQDECTSFLVGDRQGLPHVLSLLSAVGISLRS